MDNSEDIVFRHLKRTPQAELLDKWKAKLIYLPPNFISEFLEFAKFCEENNWTFIEGAVLFAEDEIKIRQEKIESDKEKIKQFKLPL